MSRNKKRTWKIDEIVAWRSAYGDKIAGKEVAWALFKPFIVLFLISYLIYFYVPVSIVFGLVGVFYGYRKLMPNSAKQYYESKALQERNNFVNNVTQILLNKKQTVLGALELVRDRMQGEFRDDVSKLIVQTYGASNNRKLRAFNSFESKYTKDVWFVHYCKQLFYAMIYGRADEKSIKDLTYFHNMMITKRNQYIQRKKYQMWAYTVITIGAYLLLWWTFTLFGWGNYLRIDGHHPVGWILNGIFLLAQGYLHDRVYMKRATDNSVTEVELG
ncbi:MAG: hypothetical protein K0Q87_166 [Neobacillus sp.]|jgi:hypothetical protein|nr:hypothetical protein [Neobacillus sp.]